jgi:polyhydroxybutyrate depolymerase
MKKIITLFFLFQTYGAIAQFITSSMMFEGLERNYNVYLPANYEEGVQWPLVFNLHGYGSNAVEQYLYSGMAAVADTGNFILCFPNGTPNVIGAGNGWNVSFPGIPSTVNDVGFIDSLISIIHAEYNINLGRVYSCGMSNGGFMSYKLACELSDRFQAIASVTGSMVQSEMDNCMLSVTMPVLQIHGTEDPTVNYDGSIINVGIEELITYWVNHNDCANMPDTTFIEEGPAVDNCSAQLISYTDCDGDREVLLYKIIGGGHTWPGASISIGVTNQDIKASVEIWNFFNKYGEDLGPVSNKDLTNNLAIDVFPNPTQNQLHIQSNAITLLSVRIVNSLGQLVFSERNINNNAYTASLSALPEGMYFVEMMTDQGRSVREFVKM